MADLLSQRRGSAVSSVSVTIETVTTTSTANSPGAPALEEATTATVSPCPPSRRGSSAGVAVPAHLLPSRATVSSDSLASSYVFPPPPPYAGPNVEPAAVPSPSRATVHPLTFFAFSTLSPLPAPPSVPLSSSRIDGLCAPPPPAYAMTPRTQAERRFWHGFFCPVLWILGAWRIWRSERPAAAPLDGAGLDGDAAAKDVMDLEAGGATLPADVRESVEVWREEELVWARRCLWALFALVGAAGIFALALMSVLGVMG